MQRVWNWLVDKKSNTLRKWQSTVMGRGSTASRDALRKLRPIGGSEYTLNSGCQKLQNGVDSGDELFASSNSLTSYSTPDFDDFFDESAEAIESAMEKKYSRCSIPPKPSSFTGASDQIASGLPMLPQNTKNHRTRAMSVQLPVTVTPRVITVPRVSIVEENDEMLQDANEISKTYPVKGDCLTADMARASSLQDENSPSLSSSPITSPSRKRSVQLELRRISNIQYVQSVSGRRTSTTILPLTSAQIHLVRSQWRQVYITKGPTVIGTSLFHRLFFKSQNTKQLFERCRLPKQFANLDSFAKAHAKATGQLIDQIVDSLDDLEPMSIELIRIGRLHAQMLPGEFTGTVWNLTAETFIDCTLEWGDKRCRSETLRQAWALITAYVMDKIREGHNEERKRQIQISSSFSASPRRPS